MTIKIKCVKSQMFDTPFFSGAMTFHAVDRQVIPPDDERWNDIFVDGEEAQRGLVKGRVREMVPYLLNNRNSAFFSALTLIMVPVDGHDAVDGQHYKFTPLEGDGGDIEIEDDVMLFVADGQHRREAIAQALRQDKAIGKQQVPVILIPFRDTSRTRQLFTDLNLNQLKVSNTLAQSFDTRDPVIMVTRRASSDFELFRGRVNMQSNSLAKRSPHVVSMNTLVSAHTELLKAFYGTTDLDEVSDLEDVKAQGLQGSATKEVAGKLQEVWQVAYEHLPELSRVVTEQLPPGKLRDGADEDEKDPWGGYVYAFGIGWQAIALATSKLIALMGPEWKPALAKCIDSIDWRKGHHWNGIAMVGTRVNNTGPGIRATAAYIIEKGGIREMIKGDLPALAERTSRKVEDLQKVAAELEAMFVQLDKSRAAAAPAEQDAPVAKAAAE